MNFGSKYAVAVVVGIVGLLATTLPLSTSAAASGVQSHGVSELTETFVDTSRPTPPNHSFPGAPSRTLVTTILYPSDRNGAPYPMIEFSPGTGTTPQTYMALLQHWAAAGFVVASPTFPLSSTAAPGGVDVGDVVNQPADASFVINSVLHVSASTNGPLAGMVNPKEIGAAGHSLGAITTIGLVGNTCCRDPQVKAAVVMAGTTEGYPNGHYEVAKAPPLMVVSGTDDAVVPYNGALAIFNEAKGPKAMLTIRGGDHQSAAGFSPTSQASVYNATTDFFDAYLRGDATAEHHLYEDGNSVAKMVFVPDRGSSRTIKPLPTPKLHLHATASRTSNLTGGETVTIAWRGFTPGKDITIVECGPGDRQLSNSAACDLTHADLLKPNPTGKGSLPLVITEGPVGTATCDATHSGCFILADNASSTVPADNVFIPITFAK